MDPAALIGPAVVAAVVSGIVAAIGFFVNRSTSLKIHQQKLNADRDLAERKTNADIGLAERKFRLDMMLADRKKRQDLAEEVLSGFYQMGDIVRAVRSPLSYPSEAKDRIKPEGESEIVGRQRDSFYAIIARFEMHRQDIADIVARRYRMVAWFGASAEQPFQLLQEALNNIITSAQLLVQWSGDRPSVAHTNTDLWHKMQRDIWWSGDDTDPVAAKIAAAIKQMEEICRPILEGSVP